MTDSLTWNDFYGAYLGKITNDDDTSFFVFDSDTCNDTADNFSDFLSNNPTIDGITVKVVTKDLPSIFDPVGDAPSE